MRLARVARYDAKVLRVSARWLFTSREHHNYTYDLTRLSRVHLAWFVSVVCGVPVSRVREYFGELESDRALRTHIETTTARAARRGLADRTVRYARRIGWYAMVRASKPEHVVEAGVDKGLGTCVLAAALLRNAGDGHPGRVTSLDALSRPVDMFLHDSDHSVEHERREFEAVEPKLAEGALLVTDNAARTDVLARHAERTGRRFLAYREQPAAHWFPGDGIGVAW
jgi:hypothetical protein